MNSRNNKKKQMVILPTWVTSIIMLLTVVLIAFVIYVQLVRYELVGEAIEAGDTTSTAMLMSPELSIGISTIIASATSPF